MKNVKPLGNRVLIKRADARMSKGGILLPESSQEKPQLGEVLAVGEGKLNDKGKLEPMEVKKGDRILFANYSGTQIETHGEGEYLILSQDDVLAILPK
jgi:chaperonin GroES